MTESPQSQFDNDIAINQSINSGVMVLDKAGFPSLGAIIKRPTASLQKEEPMPHPLQGGNQEKADDKIDSDLNQDLNRDPHQKKDQHVDVDVDETKAVTADVTTKSEGMHWVSRIMTLNESKRVDMESPRGAVGESFTSHDDQNPAADDDDLYYQQEQDQPKLIQPQVEDHDEGKIVHDNILGLLQSHRVDVNRRGNIDYANNPHASELGMDSCKSYSSTDTDDEDFDENDSVDLEDNNNVEDLSSVNYIPTIERQSIHRNNNDNHDIAFKKGNNPSITCESEDIDSQHQILFENLNRTIEKCCIEEDYKNYANSGSEAENTPSFLSSVELRELTKLCFAAMAVVFSSKQANINSLKSNIEHSTDKVMEDSSFDDDSSWSSLKENITITNSSIDSRKRVGSIDSDAVSAKDLLIPICVIKMLWKELLQRRCKRQSYSDDIEDDEDVATVDNDDEDDKNDDDDDDDTLDGILMSDDYISSILDKIWHTLVNELSFLDTVSYHRLQNQNIGDMCNATASTLPLREVHMEDMSAPHKEVSNENEDENASNNDKRTSKEEKMTSKEATIRSDAENATNSHEGVEFAKKSDASNDNLQNHKQNDEVLCIKVNYDVHFLYGHHLAQNFTKLFTFRHKKHGLPSKHRYSTGRRDKDPEVAMNAVMAAACSTFIEHAHHIILKGEALSPTMQLQYEYSMEMLPWHLMQSLQYKYVVDVLTDEVFVRRRIELMKFSAASNKHISDIEDLFSCTNIVGTTPTCLDDSTNLKFADLNITEVFLDSYRLFGNTIQLLEAKVLKQPISEEGVENNDDTYYENLEKEEKDEKKEKDEKGNDAELKSKPQGMRNNTTVSTRNDVGFSELECILDISLAFRSIGDSLLLHGLKSEAMIFFYRSLIRYEHIHEVYLKNVKKNIGSIDGDITHIGMDVNNAEFDDMTELDSPTSFDNGNIFLTTDINFLMGEILKRIASVYDSTSPATIIDAMLCYDRALSFYSRQTSDHYMEGVAHTLSSIGQLHLDMNEYKSALSCFDESLLLLKSQQDEDENDTNKNSNEIASVLACMGTIKKEMEMPNEALDYLSQALYEKVVVCGKSHPEVGFLQHSIGKIYIELDDIPKALTHFEEALRIRKAALQSDQSVHYQSATGTSSCKIDIVRNDELSVADTLYCIGTVYETSANYENAFSNLFESALIHWSHLVHLAGDQDGLLMINGIFKLLNEDTNCYDIISNLLHSLTIALNTGRKILPTKSDQIDNIVKHLPEIKSKIADLEFLIGMIHGAQYFHNMEKAKRGNTSFVEEAESDRLKAKEHLESSLALRKDRDGINKDLINPNDKLNNHEEVKIAFILYELGKLFSFSVLKEDRIIPQPNIYSPLFFSKKNLPGQEGITALSYFQDARSIVQGNARLVEAVDSLILVDDPMTARLQKMPIIYEDMLQTMAILYRKLDQYDKSVDCYNEVSILLTRMGLCDSPDVGSGESKVQNQMEKVAIASHSIGDILSDTGEYTRALKSYEEALQLRRLLDKDSLDVADTLFRKGMVYLKLKEWGQAIVNFDEALRIRVDCLPEDHRSIAACFHHIGKGYEGHGKFEQALEYYKKSQRIVARHFIENDKQAADSMYDLGNIVVVMSNLAESMIYTAPSDEEMRLGLFCLTQSRNIYTSYFGSSNLEVGNTLSLLGAIYAKFGDFNKAVDTYENALSIYRSVPMDQSMRVAKTLNLLSTTILKSEGENSENSKSLQCLQHAQQIYEDKGEVHDEDYLDVLFNLGATYTKLDAIDEAITSYEDALTVACVVLGRDHIRISVILEKLGSCLIRTRDHAEAMEFLEEALEVRKKHARFNDLVSADIHFAMGIVNCESGKLNTALESYEEAMKIRRIHLGDNHVDVAQVLNNIGSVFARNGEYQRAMNPWKQALEMYRLAGLSENHQKITITTGNIAISNNLVSVKEKNRLECTGSW